MEWLRRMPLYKWFAGYFPITLHKTAELPPDRRYLFASIRMVPLALALCAASVPTVLMCPSCSPVFGHIC